VICGNLLSKLSFIVVNCKIHILPIPAFNVADDSIPAVTIA